MEIVTLLGTAKSLVQFLQVAKLIRPQADKALIRIDDHLRQMIKVPLYEGLDRIDHAAQVTNPRRQDELLREARTKLHDAAAHPDIPDQLKALACLLSSRLSSFLDDDPNEPQVWMVRALGAYDSWLEEALVRTRRRALLKPKSTARREPLPTRAKDGVMLIAAALRASWTEDPGGPQPETSPRTDDIDQMNAEVAEAHRLARELGLDVSGRCSELKVTRFRSLVVTVHLIRVVPSRG